MDRLLCLAIADRDSNGDGPTQKSIFFTYQDNPTPPLPRKRFMETETQMETKAALEATETNGDEAPKSNDEYGAK